MQQQAETTPAGWSRGAALACVLVAACMMLAFASTTRAAELHEIFAKSDPDPALAVNHEPWDRLLGTYIKPGPQGVNLFDYAAVTPADRSGLQAYVASLEATPVSRLTKDAQLAYWINLYNALTVQVILDNFPVASIRDIKSGLFSSGPWSKELATVEGQALTLDDIEHAILRPIWQTKLIHYGVNCASIGCPNLAKRAYTAQNAKQLLEQGAADYINSPRGVRIEDGRVTASKLYSWYDDDFGSEAELLEHLRDYARPDLRAKLEGVSAIDDWDYDWSLNAPR